MCIRDRKGKLKLSNVKFVDNDHVLRVIERIVTPLGRRIDAVSYTHLRAHETVLDLVCRLLLEKKKNKKTQH